MQIHELDTFIGTTSDTTYLAIDDGTETNKIPATELGITAEMTEAEAEAGTETAPRVISPAVLNSYVTNAVNVSIEESGTAGGWNYRKWSDGTAECWGTFIGTVSSWRAWGGTYYSTLIDRIAFPSGLFIAVPSVSASLQGSSGDAWLAVNGSTASDSTNAYYLMRGSNGGETSYTLGIKATGAWK